MGYPQKRPQNPKNTPQTPKNDENGHFWPFLTILGVWAILGVWGYICTLTVIVDFQGFWGYGPHTPKVAFLGFETPKMVILGHFGSFLTILTILPPMVIMQIPYLWSLGLMDGIWVP